MGLFDSFRKKKEEVKPSNQLKVIFIEDYDDYKTGQIVDVDKLYGEFLVKMGYASLNLNIDVEKEQKKVEASREQRYITATNNATKEIMNGYNQSIKEAESLVSSLNTRLHGTPSSPELDNMMKDYIEQRNNNQKDNPNTK